MAEGGVLEGGWLVCPAWERASERLAGMHGPCRSCPEKIPGMVSTTDKRACMPGINRACIG